MNKNKVCILIPIYKDELDEVEKISLKRLYDVIGNKDYHVYLISSPYVNIRNYEMFYPGIKRIKFKREFFNSSADYSRLLLSYNFYKRFAYYDYIQIYQLDGYIFNDNIEYWCNQDYDFIGGPIWNSHHVWENTPCIGNGGVSLRKTSTFLELFNPDGEFYKMYNKLFNNIPYGNEDYFICKILNNKYDLNLPTVDVAKSYSWDLDVDIADKSCNGNLPDFCHALHRNIHYWKHKIPELNNENIIKYCGERESQFFEQHPNYLQNYK